MRRVFAAVSDDDFHACVAKSREEDLDLGQTLTILVHLYATTDIHLSEHREYVTKLRRTNGPDRTV